MIYSVLVFLVLLMGLFLIWREAGKASFSQEKIFDLVFVIGLGVLIISHLLYVWWVGPFSVVNLIYFWHTGHLFFSGLIGGLIIWWLLIRRVAWTFAESGDSLVPGILFIHALVPLVGVMVDQDHDTSIMEGFFWLLTFYLVVNRQRYLPSFVHIKGLLLPGYLILVSSFYLILNRLEGFLIKQEKGLAVAVLVLGVVGFGQRVVTIRSRKTTELTLDLTFKRRQRRRALVMKSLPKMPTVLPRQFIKRMHLKLIRREKKIQEELKLLEREDPAQDVDRADNRAEIASAASTEALINIIDWQKKFLRKSLKKIHGALKRIKEGTYGLSIKSGLPIPRERLEANPDADLTVEEAAQAETTETNIPPLERIS